jgi:hypothetical protein
MHFVQSCVLDNPHFHPDDRFSFAIAKEAEPKGCTDYHYPQL